MITVWAMHSKVSIWYIYPLAGVVNKILQMNKSISSFGSVKPFICKDTIQGSQDFIDASANARLSEKLQLPDLYRKKSYHIQMLFVWPCSCFFFCFNLICKDTNLRTPFQHFRSCCCWNTPCV